LFKRLLGSAAALGNDGMYLEKLIEEPRHIEIQIVGDAHGKACHLSERDCSVQRRHQKLVEETPSPFMTPELREAMGDDAVITLGPLDFDTFIQGWRTVWIKDPEGNIVEISQGYKDE